jgi:hypothetical protein
MLRKLTNTASVIGITGPALGAVAGTWGMEAIYLVSAVVVSLSVLVALRLMRRPLSQA